MDTERAWEQALPEETRAVGVSLQGIGIPEIAWPIECASGVIDVLRQGGWAVLGGDLFVQRASLLNHSCENWHCDIAKGEPWSSFVQRSCDSANRYLAGVAKAPLRWFTVVAVAKPDAYQLAKSYDA